MRWTFGPLCVCLLAFGCSYSDPGVEGLTRGQFAQDASPEVGPTGDSGPKTDAATDSGAKDTGADTAGTTTAFSGANAFANNKPATSAVTYHNNNMVGVTPGPGQDCLSCHKMGGSGPQFLFAGTLCADQNCNAPAVDKEIRVRGSDGKAFSAHSDDDGNFWYLPGTGEALAFPAMSGARDGTNTALMVGTITAASCNTGGCHDGNTQAYVHLP
jgi:hypothetical protein